MIERQNYKDCKEHLAYRRAVCGDAESTLDTRWLALRYMLRWADDQHLTAAGGIRPTWTMWLGEQTREDGAPMAVSTAEGMTSMVRTFFRWVVMAHPRRYRRVGPLFVDALRTPRIVEAPKERTYYTAADVEALCAVDEGSLRCRRVQAAAAMLFLSGMRSGAFVTLPIKCLDVATRAVHQWPSEGVKTKHGKAATTYLLPIPALLGVVKAWDGLVRGRLPDGALWYANFTWAGAEEVVAAVYNQSRYRAHSLGVELRWLCGLAGIPYRRPHDMRHGHVVYALDRAGTAGKRKAVSQNVMHSLMSTTDGVYARLTVADHAAAIAGLGDAEFPKGDMRACGSIPDWEGGLSWDQKKALMRKWLGEA